MDTRLKSVYKNMRIRNSGCWEWTEELTRDGYALYVSPNIVGRCTLAHQYVYTILHGKVQKDYDIHHICRNKRCIKPSHLVKLHHKVHFALHRLGWDVMATLNDLQIKSLSELPPEEGLQLILSMRERRHFVPDKPVREKKPKVPTESAIAKLSEKQLAELYYTLMAKRQQELM